MHAVCCPFIYSVPVNCLAGFRPGRWTLPRIHDAQPPAERIFCSEVQDFGGKSLDRIVKSAGFRVLQDKRFLGGMVRALKIAPASPAPSQIPAPAVRSESYLP